MVCLATPVSEVKCTHCIKLMQTKYIISKANETIYIHHAMKTPKAKLISAKNSKICQEIENRDQI